MSEEDTEQEARSGRAKQKRVLPDILEVKTTLVHFKEPITEYQGPEAVQQEKAVELLVTTSGPLQARAVTPVLMVGNVVVCDYKTVGPNTYCFQACQVDALEEGAEIRLEWPDHLKRRGAPTFKIDQEEER
ncbi:MAG: hypothetical protein AAF492_13340 [Verrucomicrobiota bacterium]